VLLLAVVVPIVVAAPASAHAVLESTTPGQGAEVDTLPAAVTLTFSESVTSDDDSLRVLDRAGSRVDAGRVTHPGGQDDRISVALPPDLARNSYTVAWRVISADSHPVSGTFTFGYGVVAGDAAAAAPHGSAWVGFLNGTARFVGYAGAVLLLGVLAFSAFVWRQLWSRQRARQLVVAGAGLLAASSLALLALAGPYDSGRGLGQLLSGPLWDQTVHTRYGRMLLVRLAVGLLAAVTAWLLLPRRLTGSWRRPRPDVTALSVVGLASFALAEHAGTGSQAPLATVVDGLHLAAVGAWVGGLLVLTVLLLPAAARPSAATLDRVLPRWSNLAFGCVAVIVGTGAYQAWREIGTLPAFTATAYGRLVLIKIGGLVLLLVLGFYGRRRVGGGRSRPAPAATDPVALPGLRRSVGAEVLLSVGVIAVAAILVDVQPGRTAYDPAWSASVTAHGIVPQDTLAVRMQVDHTRPGPATVEITVRDPDGKPVAYQEVSGLLTEPRRDLGPVRFTLPASSTGHGGQRVVVPQSGHWQLSVQVRTSATTSYAATSTYLVR